jgi:hexosaminidase
MITASSISIGCIQNWGQWVFMPRWVKFEASADGINFVEIKTVENTIPVDDRNAQLKDFSIKFAQQQIKAIRITAKNLGVCPVGHPGENQPAWVFVDEIIVE